MIDVHDYEILSYTIDLENHTIQIRTCLQGRETKQYATIVFKNVLAHYFVNDISGSIIFEIENYALDDLIKWNGDVLAAGKGQSWPLQNTDLMDLKNKLDSEDLNGYAIVPSHGMSGWVLAKEISVKSNQVDGMI